MRPAAPTSVRLPFPPRAIRWPATGPAFDRVVADPTAPDPHEAAFAAVLCYAHASGLPQGVPTGAPQQPAHASQPLRPEHERLFAAFERYLCELSPPGGDQDARDHWVETKHARAQAYFQTGRFARRRGLPGGGHRPCHHRWGHRGCPRLCGEPERPSQPAPAIPALVLRRSRAGSADLARAALRRRRAQGQRASVRQAP